MNRKYLIQILVLLALFLLAVFGYESIKEGLYHLFNKAYLLEDTGYPMNLPLLTWQHLEMSFLACSASVLIGVCLGVFAVSKLGYPFRPIIEKIASLSNALPTIGLLAIFIPIFGFGVIPGAIVLVLGGTMPIVFSVISGLINVPEQLLEVGSGMGMNNSQLFWRIKVPLAFPVLISGIRTATIIIIGSATLTAISGAGGLGIPIFNSGIRGFDPVMLLEGVIPVSLLALLMDRFFCCMEALAQKRFGYR